ncbi:MAG: hypothetical protein DRP47_10965, partial [Candidatus Zixiibacteriota bacterium]
MFSLLLRLKRAVKRLLKVQSESRQRPIYTIRSRTIKIMMLVVLSVLIGLLYPGEDLFNPFNVPRRGEIAIEDIVAPFDITVFKTERELEDEREIVRLTIPYVVDHDSIAEQAVFSNLRNFLALADSLSIDTNLGDQIDRCVEQVSSRFSLLSKSAIVQSLKREDLDMVRDHLIGIYSEDIYKVGVLDRISAIPETRNKNVLIRRGERENIYYRDRLLDVVLANARLLTALNNLYASDSIDVEYYYLIGRSFVQPTLRVNMAEYNSRIREEFNQISPIREIVNQGDIIVRSGSKVRDRQERVLQEMVRIQRNEAAQQGWYLNMLPALARILLVLLSLTTLYLFLYYFRREIFYSNARILTILIVFAFQLAVIYFISHWDISMYLYPVAFLAMMLTILFDAEVGILATIVL